MQNQNTQLSRWNLMAFFYFIKKRQQIVNVFEYILFTFNKFFFIIIGRIILTFLLSYFACQFSFFTVNVKKTNTNQYSTIIKTSNLEDTLIEKHLIDKFREITNTSHIHNIDSYAIDTLHPLQQNFFIQKWNNILHNKFFIFYTKYIISYSVTGLLVGYNFCLFFLNFALLFTLIFAYIIGFLPVTLKPRSLMNTELSWWNPLSIWYGFKKRVLHDSFFSRILWLLYYLFSFVNIIFCIVYCTNYVHIIMNLCMFLNFIYQLPRWYSKF